MTEATERDARYPGSKSDLEVIDGMIELYDGHPERWVKMALARAGDGSGVEPDDPAAVEWCVLGGLMKVGGSNAAWGPNVELWRTMNQVAAKLFKNRDYSQDAVAFNNSPATTYEKLMDWLRQVRKVVAA